MCKTPAIKITIIRAEGPAALCGTPQIFEGTDCWEQARRYLVSQGDTFPQHGGYDKHDFEVVFADGETWEGRLDCQHPECEDPDLDVAQHVYHFATCYGGLRCPLHMTPERYEKFLKHYGDMPAQMREFLAKYEIPEAA